MRGKGYQRVFTGKDSGISYTDKIFARSKICGNFRCFALFIFWSYNSGIFNKSGVLEKDGGQFYIQIIKRGGRRSFEGAKLVYRMTV